MTVKRWNVPDDSLTGGITVEVVAASDYDALAARVAELDQTTLEVLYVNDLQAGRLAEAERILRRLPDRDSDIREWLRLPHGNALASPAAAPNHNDRCEWWDGGLCTCNVR